VREGSEREQAFDKVLSQPEFPVASDKLCREKLKERMHQHGFWIYEKLQAQIL
jgi:hypothetical protein